MCSKVSRIQPGTQLADTILFRSAMNFIIVTASFTASAMASFSIVWLALDKRCENTQRYVAVKIATADSKSQEGQILRDLHGSPPSSGWLSYFYLSSSKPTPRHQKCGFIPELFDEFDIHGPNGTHHCLVMELLGPSVGAVKSCPQIEGEHLLPISTARDVAVQCAKAITSLHSKGVVHGGMICYDLAAERLIHGAYRFPYQKSGIPISCGHTVVDRRRGVRSDWETG
jgi:hypothetical protein